MLLLRVLCAAGLFTAGLAFDLIKVIEKTPPCAQLCSISVLGQANCSLAVADSCLCTNNDLQKTLATCVLKNCTVADQYQATYVRQELICKGKPQDSRTVDINTTFIILAAITYPIVLLRFLSRWMIAHKIWWDDWCILLSTACLIPLTVLPFLHVNEGFGRHFWDVQPERVVPLRKTYYAVQMIYCTVLTFSKLSILFLYLRIFLDKVFRRVIVVSMCILVCHGAIYLLCIGLQCLPVRAVWTMEPAKCLDLQAMVFSGASLSIFEDLFIMLLPIWELKKLAMSTKRKVALVFMFALGSFASITSMIRLRYIAKFGNSVDVTWDNIDVVIWSDIEMFTAVICASIICIRPLIGMLFAGASKSVSNFLGISVGKTETLPTSHKSSSKQSNSKQSLCKNPHGNHWTESFSTKLTPSRNSGHIKLPDNSSRNSTSTIVKEEEEISSNREGASTPVKVWITKNATVERGSIHMDDIVLSQDHLAASFRGRNVVEVTPPTSPAEQPIWSPRISSLSRDPER